MKIIIITDGNNELGLGHIYQSLTLANALKEKIGPQLDIRFLTKSHSDVRNFISSSGYVVEYFANDVLMFNHLVLEQPDRVIFDKLDVSPAFAAKIKLTLKKKLIIFTNLTTANQYADVAVLAGCNFENSICRDKVSGKVDFYGLKYWILRPEFYELKKKCKQPGLSVKNILLIFGGSDPANMSSHVLNTLLEMNDKFNILLILGAAFQHETELKHVLVRNSHSKSRINIGKNINNVGEKMYECDVVFASPGLSYSEALMVGTPVIGFHQNEQQRLEYAQRLPTLGLDDLYKLPLMIKNKEFICPSDPMIRSMEIGEGKDEIINEILIH